MHVLENILNIQARVAEAAARSGRDPRDVKLVAVTKTVDIPVMEEALQGQISAFGENRVQELLRKHPYFEGKVEWHLIGHLQTNKVKQVLGRVDLIHSLDRLSLAKEVSSEAEKRGLRIPVLVQVNVSGEDSKYGLAPGEVIDFVTETANYPGLQIQGLMTMAPFVTDPEETRPVFSGLNSLARTLSQRAIPGVAMRWLSMGMTNDFEIAVEEGANLIRVGSGIFGVRN